MPARRPAGVCRRLRGARRPRARGRPRRVPRGGSPRPSTREPLITVYIARGGHRPARSAGQGRPSSPPADRSMFLGSCPPSYPRAHRRGRAWPPRRHLADVHPTRSTWTSPGPQSCYDKPARAAPAPTLQSPVPTNRASVHAASPPPLLAGASRVRLPPGGRFDLRRLPARSRRRPTRAPRCSAMPDEASRPHQPARPRWSSPARSCSCARTTRWARLYNMVGFQTKLTLRRAGADLPHDSRPGAGRVRPARRPAPQHLSSTRPRLLDATLRLKARPRPALRRPDHRLRGLCRERRGRADGRAASRWPRRQGQPLARLPQTTAHRRADRPHHRRPRRGGSARPTPRARSSR